MSRIVCSVLAVGLVSTSAVAQEGAVTPQTVMAASLQAAPPSPAPAAKDKDDGDAGILSFFKGTELTGFVDMYYGYNFNKPGTGVAQLRNFDVSHNAFSFNLAELAIEKKPTAASRGGFRMDFDYGPTTAIVHASEPGTTAVFQNIQQAYVSFLAPDKKGVQFDVGKFVTQHGAEVIETKDNWNYSRSLLFALAIPYYHMGARMTVPVNDKFTFMADVVNGWNDVVDNNTGKTLGLMATVKPTAALTIVQNYMAGPEQAGNNDDWRHLLDTTVTLTPNGKVSLMANYDYGKDTIAGTAVTWQGIGGYLKVQPNAWFAFVPRAEWLDDSDGFMTGTSQKVKEVTLTGEFKHKDGVVMRLEYRRDFSNTSFFLKNSAAQVKNQSTLTVGLFYAFSSKSP